MEPGLLQVLTLITDPISRKYPIFALWAHLHEEQGRSEKRRVWTSCWHRSHGPSHEPKPWERFVIVFQNNGYKNVTRIVKYVFIDLFWKLGFSPQHESNKAFSSAPDGCCHPRERGSRHWEAVRSWSWLLNIQKYKGTGGPVCVKYQNPLLLPILRQEDKLQLSWVE